MMPVSRTAVHFAARLVRLPLVVALAASPAAAQSLGDVARKTDAARTAGATSKVYTNESLPAATAPVATPGVPQAAPQAGAQGQAGAPSGTASTPADPAKAGSEAKGATEEKGEKYWRQRIQTERDALARAQSFAEALQSRINALSTDFVNRDDPAQRNVIAGERQKALTELERVRQEIAQHTKAMADIQQEARRAGVPAGWVR